MYKHSRLSTMNWLTKIVVHDATNGWHMSCDKDLLPLLFKTLHRHLDIEHVSYIRMEKLARIRKGWRYQRYNRIIEKVDDTKDITESLKRKMETTNNQKEKDKTTNKGRPNTTQKTKDYAKRTPLQTKEKIKVRNSCSNKYRLGPNNIVFCGFI